MSLQKNAVIFAQFSEKTFLLKSMKINQKNFSKNLITAILARSWMDKERIAISGVIQTGKASWRVKFTKNLKILEQIYI